jgi:hypothetical protein
MTKQYVHLMPIVYIRVGNGMEMNVEENTVMRISRQPSLTQTVDQKQPKNVEYFRYFVSMITNDVKCTYDVKMKIATVKQQLRRRLFLPANST